MKQVSLADMAVNAPATQKLPRQRRVAPDKRVSKITRDKDNVNRVQVAFRMDKDAYRELKRMALDEDTTVNELMVRAIDELRARKGLKKNVRLRAPAGRIVMHSKILDTLITDALAIEVQDAKAAGALGYMARALVQATLPHSRPQTNEFERRNGAFTLAMIAPSKVGLPYGVIPRLRDQSRRLFTTSVSCQYDSAQVSGEAGFRIADRHMLWWDPKGPGQQSLFNSTVTISAQFCDEVRTSPIPP